MKKYPTALFVFAVYVLLWLCIGLELWDMSGHPYDYGDGKLVSFMPTLGFFLSVAYVVALIALAVSKPARRVLYQRLAIAAALPLVVMVIVVVSEVG
jgi:hypothetical protein